MHVDVHIGDSDASRREAVRRKTAQYLMKAEDLYNNQLAATESDEGRWGVSTDTGVFWNTARTEFSLIVVNSSF